MYITFINGVKKGIKDDGILTIRREERCFVVIMNDNTVFEFPWTSIQELKLDGDK